MLNMRRIVALLVLAADIAFLQALTLETSVYGAAFIVGGVIAIGAIGTLLFNLPLRRPGPPPPDSDFDIQRPLDIAGLLFVLGVLTAVPLLVVVHGLLGGAILQVPSFQMVFFGRQPWRFAGAVATYALWCAAMVGLMVLAVRRRRRLLRASRWR